MILFLILFTGLQAKPFVRCGDIIINTKNISVLVWGRNSPLEGSGAYKGRLDLWTSSSQKVSFTFDKEKEAKECALTFWNRIRSGLPR